MADFATRRLSTAPVDKAPDGSDIRVLLGLRGGGRGHFRLAAGAVAKAVVHRSVEELWYVVAAAVRCGAGKASVRR